MDVPLISVESSEAFVLFTSFEPKEIPVFVSSSIAAARSNLSECWNNRKSDELISE